MVPKKFGLNENIMVNLHSEATIKGIRRSNVERGFRSSKLLTDGPYAGWRAYGPYVQRREDRESTLYFRLKKKGEKDKNIDASEIDIVGMTEVVENKKPFIDWLKW